MKVPEAHGLNSHPSNGSVGHPDLTVASDLVDLPEVILYSQGLQQDSITPLGRMHLHVLKDPIYPLNNLGMDSNPVLSLEFKQSNNQQNLMHHQFLQLKQAQKNTKIALIKVAKKMVLPLVLH